MFEIQYITENDEKFWFTLDDELSKSEFSLKVYSKRGYVISYDKHPIGIMRYNLCWDIIPFLTLIHFNESSQRKGFGRQAVLYWENEMRNLGYNMVMTSTQVNEQAQHFYRKLGYIERGSLFFDNTPHEQPQEMFLIKTL